MIKNVLVRKCANSEEDITYEAMIKASLKLLFHSLKECAVLEKYRELLGATEEKETPPRDMFLKK